MSPAQQYVTRYCNPSNMFFFFRNPAISVDTIRSNIEKFYILQHIIFSVCFDMIFAKHTHYFDYFPKSVNRLIF